jgi:peptidyl-tRNA hydrolase
VQHLNSWLHDPALKERLPKDAKIGDLVPFINDVPLKGIHPEQAWPDPDTDSATRPQVHYLRFTLNRTETSKEGWTQILNRPVFKRPMKISVGFENGEAITTWVVPTATESSKQFFLVVIPSFRFWLGVVVIVGAFLIFLYLARCTEIIRDTAAQLRPDKRWPYSLSRGQMAFWFFLVIGSFFFLWVITGDTDTLNTSVLGLIGISAGTALGAAFAGSGHVAISNARSDLPAEVDLSKSRAKIAAQLRHLITEAEERLRNNEAQRADIGVEEKSKLEANAAAQEKETQNIANLRRQLDYFEWPAWKGVMHDLLAEDNVVCFHRFQIFIWTIVLGIMFVVNVYNQLAMPQFSATLLGLLGISAGTYVGFQIPDTKPKPVTSA